MLWYGVVWYGMVWYGLVWYGMDQVWYGLVWYGMVWYGVSDEAPVPPPATWGGDYGGKTGKSAGIIGILKLCQEDIDKDRTSAKADEDEAQGAFNKAHGGGHHTISYHSISYHSIPNHTIPYHTTPKISDVSKAFLGWE